MKFSGKTLMSLGLMGITGWMVVTALKWPLRTAIFPIVAGIPVFLIAVAEVYLNLVDKEAPDRERKETEPEFSEDQVSAKRGILPMFLWILAFFLLILFLGFYIAVPLFVFLHLKFHGKERWAMVLGLTAAAGLFFYGLFVRLLHIPFPEGWILRWLRISF